MKIYDPEDAAWGFSRMGWITSDSGNSWKNRFSSATVEIDKEKGYRCHYDGNSSSYCFDPILALEEMGLNNDAERMFRCYVTWYKDDYITNPSEVICRACESQPCNCLD